MESHPKCGLFEAPAGDCGMEVTCLEGVSTNRRWTLGVGTAQRWDAAKALPRAPTSSLQGLES
jgi:hypothetical protein